MQETVNVARRSRDEALARVDANADPNWKRAAYAAVARCAKMFDTFSTDEVWGSLATTSYRTRERRALGPIMVSAVRHGLIVKAGYRASRDPACHMRPKQTYRRAGRA